MNFFLKKWLENLQGSKKRPIFASQLRDKAIVNAKIAQLPRESTMNALPTEQSSVENLK